MLQTVSQCDPSAYSKIGEVAAPEPSLETYEGRLAMLVAHRESLRRAELEEGRERIARYEKAKRAKAAAAAAVAEKKPGESSPRANPFETELPAPKPCEGLSEVEQLDARAKRSGYGGYSNTLVGLLVSGLREGGLEDHVDKVVGCPETNRSACERWDRKFKFSHQNDLGVYYDFSEFIDDELVELSIRVMITEPGKIYVKGQSLDPGFYVFRGVLPYQDASGSWERGLAFLKVELSDGC